MRRTCLTFLGCLTLSAAAAAVGCSPGAASTGAATPARPAGARREVTAALPVTTTEVEQRSMPLAVNVIGSAEASSNVAVHSQITGELTSVAFKEGDTIRKGEIIFTLDYRPLETVLQQSQANLDRDLAQAENARSSAERYEDLMARGIATSEQTDQARTSAEALDATVLADRAALENAKVQLRYATIFSPLSGRTGALMVHEGNLVRANDTTPLVVINQISPINVSFGIPEADLGNLKRYLARGSVVVEATAPGATTPSTGRITFIDNAVDPTTGQIKIKAAFPNRDEQLWPGQFVNVTVTLSVDPHAIVVPTTAVQSDQHGPYVFVLNQNQTVDMRTITIAREVGDDTVVESGLSCGEIVVTDGQLRLETGAKVVVKQGPGQSTEATS